jgi:ketosteroid isomerase-like protein
MAISKPEDAHRMFAEAFNAGDLESLMAVYAPDALLVPQPGQVVTGHAARASISYWPTCARRTPMRPRPSAMPAST